MLSPTQILEQMLRHIAKFDGAHVADSIDQAILRAEANTLFRILRVIEESSKQRFILTANGAYLDVIGNGMEMPRYQDEDDSSYRGRLLFNEHTWNDCTLNGIKKMVESYYGISIDPANIGSNANLPKLPRHPNETDEDYFDRLAFYDNNRLVELYKQAVCFYNKDKSDATPWSDDEGWVDPTSDFGAEWLSPTTAPGAFEVHLDAFQPGEERLIKKRHLHQKLMAVRAAGIVVLLYFHIDFIGDTMAAPVGELSELELISPDQMGAPAIEENYTVTMNNGNVTSIVADIRDTLSGHVSRRIVHDRQKNKCRADYIQELQDASDPYVQLEREYGVSARRPEPFKFRQAKMRNECWRFFYGVKYEEVGISIDPKIRIPIVAIGENDEQRVVAHFVIANPSIKYVVYEVRGKKNSRQISFQTDNIQETYNNISCAADLQTALAASQIGKIVLAVGFIGSLFVASAYAQEYRRQVRYNTYYVRKNPMIDETHFYRGEDLHGLDFYPIMDYVDFWWRVSTINNGIMSSPTIPQKLTIAKIQDGFSRFWWRVTTFDGRVVHAPTTQSPLELVGKSNAPILTERFTDIRSCQLSLINLDPLQICASSTEMFVLERYKVDTNRLWRRSDIVSFRISSAPSKVILARLGIGGVHAQDPMRGFVDTLLRGNMIGDIIPIRFWTNEWFVYLKQRIDEIINSGFNGVYLDYTDLWSHWLHSQATVATDMKLLIMQISNYIKKMRAHSDFKVIVAGFQWLDDADYVDSIDGILCHNVFFQQEQAIDATLNAYYVNILSMWKTQLKKVIVVERLTDEALISHFISQAQSFGFIPCVI